MSETSCRRWFALILFAAVACAIGCTGGNEEQVKRIIILTNGTSPFWDAAKIGAEDAAKDLEIEKAGLRVVVETNDFSDKGQIDKLRQYQGMTDVVGIGISVTISENPNIAAEMRKLQKSGVHVITIDSDVDLAQDRDARFAYVGTDNVYAGRELGKAAAALKPDGAKYSTFVGLAGAANAKERISGFAAGAGAKFTAGEHLADGGDQQKARQFVRDAIDRNADMDMLVGIWSYNAPAIVDTVKQLGRRADFTIVCFDAEPVAIDHMDAGMIDALAVQNPYRMGYDGVRVLKALVEKDSGTIAEMRSAMNKGGGEDLLDTGLKIIIPDGDTPLAETAFGERTERLGLGAFKTWLESKGLTGS